MLPAESGKHIFFCVKFLNYNLKKEVKPENTVLQTVVVWIPMRPKARGLVQHGGPPGWLEESDPAGCDFERDPVPTDRTACPGWTLELYSAASFWPMF